MRKIIVFRLLMCMMPTLVSANDPPQCNVVRMADIGWTDVTSTTALATELLTILGYEPRVFMLSTPVTFAGLKHDDLDVFLGNWMPTQEGDIRQYLNEGSVVQLKQNLKGAVFSLAVPDYVYDAGVHSISDLLHYKEMFKSVIYGIEPGNDGNRLILKMIEDDAFGLRQFRLIESSEQGMIVTVKEAIKDRDFIVFLAWAPHPMNISISLKYLSDQDKYFGPNFGESSVFTVTRRNFATDCPNLASFFKNLVFSVDAENQMMSMMLHGKMSPKQAARNWLKNNKKTARAFFADVKTIRGQPAQRVFDTFMSLNEKKEETYVKAPLGQWIENAVTLLTSNFAPYFRQFSLGLESIVQNAVAFLLLPHWGVLILILCILSYALNRSLKLVSLVALGLLFIVNLGLWTETIKTLVLVIFASLFSLAFGIPLGITAARYPWFYKSLRPMLDLMQTIPTFVYLIPTLMLFGLGLVPGLISTVIFAVSAPIRLTYLGIIGVPKELVEASNSFGATKMQTLFKVEIPYAMPSITTGFTQCIMLSLSMVVIAALVGADGLGTPVVRALNTVNIGLGFESGIAIVILAILLDRTLCLKSKHKEVA